MDSFKAIEAKQGDAKAEEKGRNGPSLDADALQILHEIKVSMNAMEEKDWKLLFTVAAYQGYNMSTILRALGDLMRQNKVLFLAHLSVVMAFYILNGTNMLGSKMSDGSFQSQVRDASVYFKMKKKYNSETKAIVPLRPDEFTVSRICACFPAIIGRARIWCGRPSAGVILDKTTMFSNNPLFCSPEGANFIPKNDIKMFDGYLAWTVEHHALISQKSKSNYDQRVIRTKWQSSMVPDDERMTVVKEEMAKVDTPFFRGPTSLNY